MSIHRRNHWNLQVEQRKGQALDATSVLLPDVHLADLGRCLPLHLANVTACTKRRSIAGQNHAAHTSVVVNLVDGCKKLGNRRVAGQRIALLRLVHGQRDDRAVTLEDQKIAHGGSSCAKLRFMEWVVVPTAARSARSQAGS